MATSVTIELTGEQLAWLRGEVETVGAAHMAGTHPGAILLAVSRGLPPEPVRVTIELPPGLVDKLGKQHAIVPDDPAVDLWRLVEKALGAKP